MKRSKYSLLMMVLLSLSSFSVNTVDSKEETGEKSTLSRNQGTRQEKRFIAAVGADGVQRVEMIGGEYFFDPNYIVVKVDKPVELKIKKTPGYIRHNLIASSPEAGIAFNIELTTTPQTVSFTPTKVGRYPICSDKCIFWFKTDREKGMEGVIEVVE